MGRKVENISRKTISIFRWTVLGRTIRDIRKRFNIQDKTVYKHRKEFVKRGWMNRLGEATQEGRKIFIFQFKHL